MEIVERTLVLGGHLDLAEGAHVGLWAHAGHARVRAAVGTEGPADPTGSSPAQPR